MNTRLALLVVLLTVPACRQAVDERGVAPVATCSLGGLEANPSGLHRSGSVGGVALEGDPELSASDVVPVELLAELASEPFAEASLQHSVVLLVADDFGSIEHDGVGIYRLGPDVYRLSYRQYLVDAAVMDVTYPMWLEDRLDELVSTGQLSHGALVLTYTLDLFQELGAVVVEDADDRVVLSVGGAEVVLQSVEVAGLTAQEVGAALEQVSDEYRSQGYERFVVNMSFTLEPCQSIREFRSSDESSFDAFLAAAPPSIGPGDPLYDFVNADTRDTVFVAAAGNFGGEVPRQPGRMPEVISVSAGLGVEGGLFEQSNSGEVMAPGVWVPLNNPFGRTDATEASREVLMGGTSLAAPSLSVASTIDFGSAGVRCADPSLGSRLAHGAYTDPTLEVAVDAHCLPSP